MSLNGKWNVIIDPIEKGDWLKVWEERKPENRTDFVEYSFEGSPVLNVPGDFNTQLPELTYYVGSIWYQKSFNYSIKKNKRLFVHFGAINYLTTVYLNGKLLGKHEGDLLHFNLK